MFIKCNINRFVVIRNELNRIEMRSAKKKMALDGEMINEKKRTHREEIKNVHYECIVRIAH